MQIENIESMLRQPFPDAMSQPTNSVCVVTTDGNGGQAGTTVTAMTAVSADSEAPSLLICLHADSLTAKAIASTDIYKKTMPGLRTARTRDEDDMVC